MLAELHSRTSRDGQGASKRQLPGWRLASGVCRNFGPDAVLCSEDSGRIHSRRRYLRECGIQLGLDAQACIARAVMWRSAGYSHWMNPFLFSARDDPAEALRRLVCHILNMGRNNGTSF